ncbi:MAG: hypothetical protein HY554_11645, partial [Elusimicrobia bacterium]|nr:hypothetical protein [Elusimicrobiota bacterium]
MARQRRPVARKPGPVAAFLAVAAVYLAGWALLEGARAWRRPVRLGTLQPSYGHDQFVEIRLRTRDPELRARWGEASPRVAVFREGRLVRTIGGLEWLALRWDEGERAFVARWPCPWNAPAGRYELSLAGAGELGGRLLAGSFELERRKPNPLPPGFVALTLEGSKPLSGMSVRAPDGSRKDWRGLLDWAEYLEADAFWLDIGETPGSGSEEVWASDNFALVPAVAEECRKRGLALGLYAKSYLTMSKEPLGRYEYAWDVVEGKLLRTRAISLRDPERAKDIAALLARFKDVPGVRHLGLDYIRNALGGYELLDDFFAEMPGVRPPPGWDQLSREERMIWFHHKKVMRKDAGFVDAWQWWRAHRVGRVVRQVREAVGPDALLWAFSLTWQRGWHHGQDPVMMNDAGVDADALMLYEADEAQFETILRDFHRYVERPDAQLVVGDVVDWPLHQRSPRGPGELRRRLARGVDRIYADGAPAAG